MDLSVVSAVSPVDGRYHKQTESLAYYFSEAAFINFRVFVSVVPGELVRNAYVFVDL